MGQSGGNKAPVVVWTVEKANGEIVAFTSLVELKKAASDGVIGPEDVLIRVRSGPQKLAEIDELRPLLEEARPAVDFGPKEFASEVDNISKPFEETLPLQMAPKLDPYDSVLSMKTVSASDDGEIEITELAPELLEAVPPLFGDNTDPESASDSQLRNVDNRLRRALPEVPPRPRNEVLPEP